MQTSKPALELLTSDAIYRENPTALFHQLCGARPATLLLESADIDSKDDLKAYCWSIALRITALGDTVTIQALRQRRGAAGTTGRRAALRDHQSAPAQRPHPDLPGRQRPAR